MIKFNKTIQLYDCFKSWGEFSQIFVYGDPHFSDLESYKFRFPEEYEIMSLNAEQFGHSKDEDEKEFVKELDEMQVKNINKVCGTRDVLIITGDVGNIEYVKKLKAGCKVLILGNHDRGASYYKREIKEVEHNSDTCPKCGGPVKYDGMTSYNCGFDYAYCSKCGTVKPKDDKYEDNHLFDEVYEGTLQINPKIMLSHEPVEYKYCLNIHSHVHQVNPLGAYTEGINCTSHYNCCAEQINYTPVNLSLLIKAGILSNIPDIHRETIDRATSKIQSNKRSV